jgi:hypothetical protein
VASSLLLSAFSAVKKVEEVKKSKRDFSLTYSTYSTLRLKDTKQALKSGRKTTNNAE